MAADADENVSPHDPAYLDESAVRGALTIAFDACHSCRACSDLCDVFPRLFSRLDRLPDRDAGGLTPVEQDHVVDACLHCGRCATGCVDTVDIPRLMLRAVAMRRATGQQPIVQQIATRVLMHSRGTSVAPIGAPPGSLRRTVAAKLGGVSAVRVLPPRARPRFSTWFAHRTPRPVGAPGRRVVLVPTCGVEYHDPTVGRDAVSVYERSGVVCSLSEVACCGAPWLHAGELERFRRVAERNVIRLAGEVRTGAELVVLHPTCLSVMQQHYPEYVPAGLASDARLVADRLVDVTDHVVDLHRQGELAAGFDAALGPVTYHQACPRQASGDGSTIELLRMVSTDVEVVAACAGTGAMWGLRTPNADIAVGFADRLVTEIERRDPTGERAIVTECSLAAVAIVERGGSRASHPISLLAAMAIDDDGGAGGRAAVRPE